jgi:hypothetical protein
VGGGRTDEDGGEVVAADGACTMGASEPEEGVLVVLFVVRADGEAVRSTFFESAEGEEDDAMKTDADKLLFSQPQKSAFICELQCGGRVVAMRHRPLEIKRERERRGVEKVPGTRI